MAARDLEEVKRVMAGDVPAAATPSLTPEQQFVQSQAVPGYDPTKARTGPALSTGLPVRRIDGISTTGGISQFRKETGAAAAAAAPKRTEFTPPPPQLPDQKTFEQEFVASQAVEGYDPNMARANAVTLQRGAGPGGSDLISGGSGGGGLGGFGISEKNRLAEVARQEGESAEFRRVADAAAFRDQVEAANLGVRRLSDAADVARMKIASGNIADMITGQRELASILPQQQTIATAGTALANTLGGLQQQRMISDTASETGARNLLAKQFEVARESQDKLGVARIGAEGQVEAARIKAGEPVEKAEAEADAVRANELGLTIAQVRDMQSRGGVYKPFKDKWGPSNQAAGFYDAQGKLMTPTPAGQPAPPPGGEYAGTSGGKPVYKVNGQLVVWG